MLNGLDFCAGSGIGSAAFEACGFARTLVYIERDAYCQRVLQERMRTGDLSPGFLWDDAKTFDGRPWAGVVDFVFGGIPCFGAGTLILTKSGYQPIEDVRRGELVLTHEGRWRPVTNTMQRDNAELVRVAVQGSPGTVTTADHPYLARMRSTVWDNSRRRYVRSWTNAEWTPAGELAGDHFAAQVLPEGQYDDRTEEFWWVVGRYLADGWLLKRASRGRGERATVIPVGHVIICCSNGESDELRNRIGAAGFHCFPEQCATGVKWHIANANLHHILSGFGKYAHGKLLPGWVHELPQRSAEALLTGYLSGDGYQDQRTGEWRATTVSKQLAMGVALLAQQARGVVASVRRCAMPKRTVIEGREVNQRNFYVVGIPRSNRSAFVEGNRGWKLVRRVVPAGTGTVYNLSVAEDESYVADGCVVHNCQPYSCAGKQQGEADERDLWPDFRRVLGEIQPRVALVENVAGFVAHGGGLQRVCGELAEDGYVCEWATVGAWEVGANHRRDRVWVVAYASGEPGWEQYLREGEGRDVPGSVCAGRSAPDPGRPVRRPGLAEGRSAEGRDLVQAGWAEGADETAQRGEGWAAADASGSRREAWTGDGVGVGAARSEGPAACDPHTATTPDATSREEHERRRGDVAGTAGRGEGGNPAAGPGGADGAAADTCSPRLEEQQRQRRDDGPECPPAERDGLAGQGRLPQPDLRGLDDGLAPPLAGPACADWWASWPPGPGIPPLATGVPERTDKLRTLGNGWVPHVACYVAGRIQAWLDRCDE